MKTYYYMSDRNRRSSYLAHHGIKGMHWGARNGPPYPLDYSSHTVEQKRKNAKSTIDGDPDTTVKKYKSNRQNGNNRNPTGKDAWEMDKDNRFKESLNTKSTKANKSTTTKFKNDEVHRNTKKIITAAAIGVGVGAGIYLAYKYNAVSRISDYIRSNTKNQPMSEVNLLKQSVKDPNIRKILSNSLSEVDTVLPAGSVLKREVGNDDFDLQKTAGRAMYTTFKESDASIYRQFLRDWPGTGKRYEVTMEALKDIKMPSDVKAIEIFNKVWEENPEYKEHLIQTIMTNGLTREAAEREVKNDPFSSGMYALVKGGKDSEIFYNELRKNGYNAVRDYFDSPVPGSGMRLTSRISDHATILLDAYKDVKVKDISKVDSLAFHNVTPSVLKDLETIMNNTKVGTMRVNAAYWYKLLKDSQRIRL